MTRLVLASLALYAGTAAVCLFLAHRFVLPIRRAAALVLAAVPLLLTGRATFTGAVFAPLDVAYQFEPFFSHRLEAGVGRAQTPLLSDVVFSMIPWQKAVRESIQHGRAPLWNRFVLSGEPLLAVQQPAALHPLTWAGLLLPLPQSWTFQMSARLFVALLSAFLLCRGLGCGEPASILGAVAWGFSSFVVFWIGYPVGNAVGPLPLLLLGLTRLVSDHDRRAVALTLVSLVAIVAAGHPEALLFCVAGAGVYFSVLLLQAGRGRRSRPVLLALGTGVLALGILAVQLWPFAEALPRTWEHVTRSTWYAHTRKSADLAASARAAVPLLLPAAPAASGDHPAIPASLAPPGAYAGLLVLPLAACGLLCRDPRRWGLLAMGLAGFALALRLSGWTDAVTRLPLLNLAVVEYAVFLLALALAALAALGANELAAGRGRVLFLAVALVASAATVLLFRHFYSSMRELGASEGLLRRSLGWELGPVALSAAVLAALPRGRPARGAAAVLAAVLLFARVGEQRGVYPTYPAASFFPRLALLDPIPRGRVERIVGLGYTLIPNASALYELEDVRGYESMTLRPYVETYPLWCVPLSVWFNRVDDLTRPFLSFLNVRWAVAPSGTAPPPGWASVFHDPGGELFENTRVVPRVFVPEWVRSEPDDRRRVELLAGIADFGERGVLASAPGAPPGDWVRNGAARVEIAAYRPPSVSATIEASEPAIVGSSITAWPGWEASLDGGSLAPLSYNHAFLGFAVPAGRHTLELRYRPRSFVAGAAVSVASLLVAVAAMRSGRLGGRVLSSPPPP